MRTRRVLSAVALGLLALLTLPGCSEAAVEYIPDGGSYTLPEVQERATGLDLGATGRLTTAEAPEERLRRLSELRQNGDEAALVADALTSGFPADNPSVPVLVEGASVDDRPVWVIVEAWGEEGGTLGHRRLWVLDRTTFDVVSSSSFR